MSKTLVFDVNETLLDLQALCSHFERAFGDVRVMEEWFGLMLPCNCLSQRQRHTITRLIS